MPAVGAAAWAGRPGVGLLAPGCWCCAAASLVALGGRRSAAAGAEPCTLPSGLLLALVALWRSSRRCGPTRSRHNPVAELGRSRVAVVRGACAVTSDPRLDERAVRRTTSCSGRASRGCHGPGRDRTAVGAPVLVIGDAGVGAGAARVDGAGPGPAGAVDRREGPGGGADRPGRPASVVAGPAVVVAGRGRGARLAPGLGGYGARRRAGAGARAGRRRRRGARPDGWPRTSAPPG